MNVVCLFEGFLSLSVYNQNNAAVNAFWDTVIQEVASFGEVCMKH